MTRYFFDTSALAKAYHREVGTPEVLRIFGEPGSEVVVSSLSTVEFQSVFARKVRMGHLTSNAYDSLRKKFGGDVKAGRLRVKCLFRRHQVAAEKLIAAHGPTRGLRTLDSLQLAMAIELVATNAADCFVAADCQLLEIAALEGLTVLNPGVA